MAPKFATFTQQTRKREKDGKWLQDFEDTNVFVNPEHVVAVHSASVAVQEKQADGTWKTVYVRGSFIVFPGGENNDGEAPGYLVNEEPYYVMKKLTTP